MRSRTPISRKGGLPTWVTAHRYSIPLPGMPSRDGEISPTGQDGNRPERAVIFSVVPKNQRLVATTMTQRGRRLCVSVRRSPRAMVHLIQPSTLSCNATVPSRGRLSPVPIDAPMSPGFPRTGQSSTSATEMHDEACWPVLDANLKGLTF